MLRVPSFCDVGDSGDALPDPSQRDIQRYADASRMGEHLDTTVAQWVRANLFRLDSYLTFTEIGKSHMHLVHYLFDVCITVVGGAGAFVVRQMGLMRHTSGPYMLCIIKPHQAYSVLSTNSYCSTTRAVVATLSSESCDAYGVHIQFTRCILVMPDAVCTPLSCDGRTVHYMDISSFDTPLGYVDDAYSTLRDAVCRLASLQIDIQPVLDARGLVCNPHYRRSDCPLHAFIHECTRHTNANMSYMFGEELRDAFMHPSMASSEPCVVRQVGESGSVRPPGIGDMDASCPSTYAWRPVSFPLLNPIKAHGTAWTIEAIYKGRSHGKGFIITLLDEGGAPQQVVNCPLSMVKHTTQCHNAIMLSPTDAFDDMSRQWWSTHGKRSFQALGTDMPTSRQVTVREEVLLLLRSLGKDKEGLCLMLHDCVNDSDVHGALTPSPPPPPQVPGVGTDLLRQCIISSQATQQQRLRSIDKQAYDPETAQEEELTASDEMLKSPAKEPRLSPRVDKPDISLLTLPQAIALNTSYCGSCISTVALHETHKAGRDRVQALEPVEHLVMGFHFQTSVATHAFKETCVYEHMTSVASRASPTLAPTPSNILHACGILQSTVEPYALVACGDGVWAKQ